MRIKNCIVCFVLITFFTICNAESQESQTPQKTDNKLIKTGIGFQTGIRFHQPDQVNNFITSVYQDYLTDYIAGAIGKKKLGPGVFFTVNGTIDIGRFFSVAPFAQGMWAGNQVYISGGPAGNININSYTAMGGLNLWLRLVNKNVFKLRVGGGFYGTYTYLNTTGDVSHRRISGSGFGGRALVGSEYHLNDKITLTFDCGPSFGKSNLPHQSNSMSVSGIPITYPKELNHLGFELIPGIMFYF